MLCLGTVFLVVWQARMEEQQRALGRSEARRSATWQFPTASCGGSQLHPPCRSISTSTSSCQLWRRLQPAPLHQPSPVSGRPAWTWLLRSEVCPAVCTGKPSMQPGQHRLHRASVSPASCPACSVTCPSPAVMQGHRHAILRAADSRPKASPRGRRRRRHTDMQT